MSRGELKVESIESISGRLFDEQLKKLNLNKDQIDVQKLPELRESLSRINEAIAHPEGFGEFFVQYSAKVGVFVAQSTSDYNRRIGILPILLERKKMILDRIRELSANEKIDSIEDLADQLSEGEIKRKLTEELHILRDDLSKYKKRYAGNNCQ
jgi:hypothetical protein